MITIIIALSITLSICLYVIFNSFRKFDRYDQIISEINEENGELLDFISKINIKLFEDFEQLKVVDKRGSFEADDEVGFVFVTIKNIIEESFLFVNNFLNSKETDVEHEKKE